MGIDPISLAAIGSAIFGATQANKRPPSKKPVGPAAELENVDDSDTTGSRKRRRRSLFSGQAQNVVDSPLG